MNKKEESFMEWYHETIEKSALCDKRYPIKGLNVWTPYGWKIMRLIDEYIRDTMDSRGHSEVNFPLLIPETEFKKEADHIKGFNQQVYWVTHGGDTALDIKLLLRPTSETAMYPMFALWVRSHMDLPLRVYQIVNVFRYETKQTRDFIRVREIHFFEGHTCHVDFEDAERQIKEDLQIMAEISKKLSLPYIASIRPDWDKFAGAYYSIGIDTIMESGRTLQIASIHQYQDNFAKAYEIKYEDKDGTHKYVHQTTYGMSERLVGAVVGVHGDELGLILPPEIAPVQVIIVPIYYKEEKNIVEQECKNLEKRLLTGNIRCKTDMRDDVRPGSKFYDWEIKGVPLRIEIGKKELESKKLLFVRRDTKEKKYYLSENVVETVKSVLNEIQDNLYKIAESKIKKRIFRIKTYDDATAKNGIFRVNWCGSEECGHEIETRLDVSILGIPYNREKENGTCIACSKETDTIIYIGKTY